MKQILKIAFVITLVSLISCKKEEVKKDYVTLSGKIENHIGNEIKITGKGFEKIIKMDENGSFKDTLKVADENSRYIFFDGNEYAELFLKNGYEVNINLDTKKFDETIKFSGKGAETNNYLANKTRMQKELFTPSLFDAEEKEFDATIATIEKKLSDFINNAKGVDSTLIATEKMGLANFKKGIKGAYMQQKARKAQYASFVGKPAPDFKNYENIDGSKTSLKDLRGKNIYIDVWATWCGPCIREVPALKELEHEYKDKNIAFVSISVDNGRGYPENSLEKAKEGWKKMIAEKELKGIQLFADKNWQSDFIKAFKIRSIPRFILIDHKGNVVDADAPRPSSKKIKEAFNKLKL